MAKKNLTLIREKDHFISVKKSILKQWVSYDSPKKILELHNIDENYFIEKYASGIFDYFMDVISQRVKIGNSPFIQEFLVYLKFKKIGADELFEICSHFRRAMIDVSYDLGMNSKELFDELSYIFDINFRGILKFYTDTIFQKLIDARQEAILAGEAREYFLSNMSHEIRTPLNAILGFVNLLMDEDISKRQRDYLTIILKSGENLLNIINDILDFSKLRSGEFSIEPKVFSPEEELGNVLELFVASAKQKNIQFSAFIDPAIPAQLYGDVVRMKQIISNFLSNAIKFTPENGLVEVEAYYEKGILNVSVSDNGVGIDIVDLKRVFSAFSQLQSANMCETKGSGLGLSIAYQLAKLMNGKVKVASVVGSGSTFYMQIPLEVASSELKTFSEIEKLKELRVVFYAQSEDVLKRYSSFFEYCQAFSFDVSVVKEPSEDFDLCITTEECFDAELKHYLDDEDKKFILLNSFHDEFYEGYKNIVTLRDPLYPSKIEQALAELRDHSFEVSYEKKIIKKFDGHILLAEDNEANQELMKIILTKYALTFDVAQNGKEAYELFVKNKYDLILMDEQMPIMDGIESSKKIIAYEKENGLIHTPIISLSANVMNKSKKDEDIEIFSAFLSKPIVLEELEKVFTSYLCLEVAEKVERIEGFDKEKLLKELMLSEDELFMLLNLFIKKMHTILPQLQEAIKSKEYKQIALKAHSVKGSSANFRMEDLVGDAAEIEAMAKKKECDYDYIAGLKRIEAKVVAIEASL